MFGFDESNCLSVRDIHHFDIGDVLTLDYESSVVYKQVSAKYGDKIYMTDISRFDFLMYRMKWKFENALKWIGRLMGVST